MIKSEIEIEIEIRQQHIDFIIKDTKERGETIISNITFFGALYQCSVKSENAKRSKKVNYSASKNVMQGYREIRVA